ncbi:MAG: transcription termination/antitermination NusG family protein [Sphaerochaetaceae bacterium]
MGYYIISCITGHEEQVLKATKRQLVREVPSLAEKTDFVFPVRLIEEHWNGKWVDVRKPLIPSYFFARSSENLDQVADIVSKINYSLGFLTYKGEQRTALLKGRDMDYASWVFSNNGEIKKSKVVLYPNQKIKVISGPLAMLHGKILRVDKHQRKILIEIQIATNVVRVSLGAEFVAPEEITTTQG